MNDEKCAIMPVEMRLTSQDDCKHSMEFIMNDDLEKNSNYVLMYLNVDCYVH